MWIDLYKTLYTKVMLHIDNLEQIPKSTIYARTPNYRALEAACAAYASLNLSLLHYITLQNRLWFVGSCVVSAIWPLMFVYPYNLNVGFEYLNEIHKYMTTSVWSWFNKLWMFQWNIAELAYKCRWNFVFMSYNKRYTQVKKNWFIWFASSKQFPKSALLDPLRQVDNIVRFSAGSRLAG